MLEYSEYKSLIEVLDKSEDTYKDLMKKEDKVLDTVNAVVNHYKDKKHKQSAFLHMSLTEIYHMFFIEWPAFWIDIKKVQSMQDMIDIVMKNNRLIYIGIVCVIAAMILFFVETSSG